MITLRPECIHLGEGFHNQFQAVLAENVYVGECVKIKGDTGSQMININLRVSEYRKLKKEHKVTFGFDKESVSLIYN